MKRLGSLLSLLVLALAVAALLRISLQPDNTSSVGATASVEQAPLYIAHQATWIRYDQNDAPQLRAQAERIDYFEDRSMKLSQVALDRLGGKDGYWHASAPEGLVPAGESRMRLQPDVKVTGTAPKSLPTQIAASEVWVDWDRQQLYSDKPVRVSAPRRTATARSWRSNFAAQRVQLEGQVEMQYDAPPR